MEQSEQINELATALAKAQGQIKPAIKDSANPFFRSTYADLASVWDACREALSANGLCVIQTTDQSAEAIIVITTLAHASGQWIRGKLPIKPIKNEPQSIGSAITYARRYALAAITGVAPEEEDDDGEGAMGREKKQKPPLKEPQPQQQHTEKPPLADPSSELLTTTQNIVSVEEVPGTSKKTGKPYIKYIITDSAKTKYWTFSKTIADNATKAKDAGIRAELGYEKGQYGNELKVVTLVEMPENPTTEALACPQDNLLPATIAGCAMCMDYKTCEVAKELRDRR